MGEWLKTTIPGIILLSTLGSLVAMVLGRLMASIVRKPKVKLFLSSRFFIFLIFTFGSAATIYLFAKEAFNMILQYLTAPSPLWVTSLLIILIILYASYARLIRSKKYQILVDLLFVGGFIAALIVAALLSRSIMELSPTSETTGSSSSPSSIVTPKPPPEPIKPKGTVLLEETFSDDHGKWRTVPASWNEGYTMTFNDGRFDIDSLDGQFHLSLYHKIIKAPQPKPKNFDLELLTTWRSGAPDMWYGLAFGVDKQTYYKFGINADGLAMITKSENGKEKESLLPIKMKTVSARKADSFVVYKLKVKFQGEKIYFYAGQEGKEERIGDINNTITFDQFLIGLFVDGKQKVSFCYLLFEVW